MSKLKSSFPNSESSHPEGDQSLKLPFILLSEQVIFPKVTTLLLPTIPRDVTLLKRLYGKGGTFVALHERPTPQEPCFGTETAVLFVGGDTFEPQIIVEGKRRVLVQKVDKTNATVLPVDEIISTEARSLRDALKDIFSQVVALNEDIPLPVADLVMAEEDPSRVADYIASITKMGKPEEYSFLAELNVQTRLSRLLALLQPLLAVLEAHSDVNNQVQNDMARTQREMYLREQLRVIQTELGEGDPFQQETIELHHQILDAKMPPTIEARAMSELTRLNMLTPMSPEAGILRTYLQWLIDVPWSVETKDNLNLSHAEKVLNKAHYGLEKVKERVLEHIAVRKLAGKKMKSPILCFVGPPGVGKTSLGKSIADALGRKFVRVSLGGVRDEAEIRGHRRTYIGALPGRIIQTMKLAGTNNPVFMLDEIDKIGDDYRGDPAAALLEVLDPEQNNAFSDHYLEVPYDLSNVLFITTANDLDPLPEALEDRLEVIEFRAYTEEEKIEIAKQFLVPKSLEAHGLTKQHISFELESLQTLVRHYTLEAGVRNLEREIASVCRKLARLVAGKKEVPTPVTGAIVEKFLGPQYVLDTRVNREDGVGLVTGLVWSPSGGDTQTIEVSLLPGKGTLTLTGQLGDILQESAQAALSYMRSRAHELGVPADDFEDYDVHIHLPEGSVPKDGPSAGIALAIGIISVFTEQKVRSNYAMTGEITLRGHVLPVGGIKEKLLAARRHKIMNVILPADNEKDLVDIPDYARNDLNIHFVRHMQEVIDIMLLEAPTERYRDILAAQQAEEDAKGDES